MALRARVLSTRPRYATTPAKMLWEGNLVFEDPDKPDANGRPSRLLVCNAILWAGSNGDFLAGPVQQEAFVRDDGRAFTRSKPNPKGGYYPLLTLGDGLQRLAIPVIKETVKALAAEASGDLTSAASSVFGEESFEDLAF